VLVSIVLPLGLLDFCRPTFESWEGLQPYHPIAIEALMISVVMVIVALIAREDARTLLATVGAAYGLASLLLAIAAGGCEASMAWHTAFALPEILWVGSLWSKYNKYKRYFTATALAVFVSLGLYFQTYPVGGA